MKKKTLAQFEQEQGQPKISRLTKQLATERAKVEALAGIQNKVQVETRKECRLKFALIGDTHIGSLYFRADNMTAFYEYARSQGVKDVYHAGDCLSGHRVFRGHEFEVRDLGYAAQIARLASDAPDCGLTTHFITGNHDASFKILAGAPVGQQIEQERPDWRFMGEEQAQVRFDTPSGLFLLRLVHPGGGTAYALSYKSQKMIESLSGGDKPDMLAIGHYHKAEMIPSYRNICGVQVGTFETQTPFMARQSLAAHVGGWIMDVTVGDGHNVVRGEFVAFYI